MSSLQERVVLALSRAQMKPTTLATKAKVSRATVSLWVNGPTQTIEGENLTRAASALGVDAHWLATGEGVPYPDLKAESPVAGYQIRGPITLSELLDALRDQIRGQKPVVRNCVAQLVTSYLVTDDPEASEQTAEAIRRLVTPPT